MKSVSTFRRIHRLGRLAGIVAIALTAGVGQVDAATYTVTNTSGSSGTLNSLPWAVQQANSHPGFDIIAFNIPGSGVRIISIAAPLSLTDQVAVDGESQPGYAGFPLVYLQGTASPSVTSLLVLQGSSSGSTIQGLGLYGYTSNAVTIFQTSVGNWIQNNYMGFLKNGGAPVLLNSALYPETRAMGIQSSFNVIRGNTMAGVDNAITIGEDPLSAWSGTKYGTNAIQYNRIGTNPEGSSNAGYGNSRDAIFMGAGAKENFIGPGNVLSGNGLTGVELYHISVVGNVVFGNLIGVDATGTFAIPNQGLGVLLANGANGNAIGGAFGGNVIAANYYGGISIGTAPVDPGSFTGDANGNWVQNNIIGLDVTQTAAPGPQAVGVGISLGSTRNAVEGNVLAGNGTHGAQLVGVVSNSVSYNWIGMSSSGAARPNGAFGIFFRDSSYNFATGNAFGPNPYGPYAGDGTSCCNVIN